GLSSDAGLNLVNAVRVAGAPEARGLGVLVLLNDEVQAAREVTKTSTLRLETFRSPDLGMLGYADPDGRVAIYRRPTRRHAPAGRSDRTVEPGGERSRPAPHRPARAALRRRRQSHAAEGACARHAGSHSHGRRDRGPAHVRRVLRPGRPP